MLSLTTRVYLHSFSCCCLPNLKNPTKFPENSNLYSSKSSKVIDLGVNQKRICNFLLVINSNFGRISYSFRDIEEFSFKIACFPTPPLFDAAQRRNAVQYQRNVYTSEKHIQWATIFICPIAIAQHGTDYKIAGVCLSVCVSVIAPTVATLNRI